MAFSVPDLQTPVIDRLFAIYGRLMPSGIQSRSRLEPANASGANDVPLVYTLVGGLQSPVPANRGGSVTTTRLYIARLLGSPLASAGDTERGEGNSGIAALVPFIAVFYSYFLTHPLLELGEVGDTDYLGPLSVEGAFMTQDLQITDVGPGDVAGPGGLPHYALDFNLYITMRASVVGLG